MAKTMKRVLFAEVKSYDSSIHHYLALAQLLLLIWLGNISLNWLFSKCIAYTLLSIRKVPVATSNILAINTGIFYMNMVRKVASLTCLFVQLFVFLFFLLQSVCSAVLCL